MSWASAWARCSSIFPTPTPGRRRRRGSRAYAAANPTPRWIVGRGWNQERWRPRPLPDRRRSRRRGRRPAGLARAGRRPCRLGEQRSRCARPISPPPPRRPPAAGSSGPGAAPTASSSMHAMSLMERAVPPPLPLPARPGAGRARRRYCSPTASPPSPTWARPPRIGR